jgi:hypothetical protein
MDKPARAPWPRRPPIRSGAEVAHYASLLGAFLLILYMTRREWFWFDEWEFLTRGFNGHPLLLFVPHAEHWSTIPILIYRGLFNVFGVRSYQPYIAVLLLAHIAVAHLLWRLMLRSAVEPWVATTLSALFLVLGAAYENIVWAFQIGFDGSFAFGLAAVLVVERNRIGTWRGTALSWVLLVAALMCSGVGVSMVAVAALTALFGRGLRAAVTVMSVPTAAFLVWFIVYGRQAIGGQVASLETVLQLPEFVRLGIASALDGLAGFAGVGALGAIVIAAWLIWRRHETATHPLAFAGAIGAVIYYLVAGAGRSALNVGEAAAPRHVYAVALLLPAIAWMLNTVARRDLLAQIAVCVLVAFCAALGFSRLSTVTHGGLANSSERFPPGQSERQILAAAALLQGGLRAISNFPEPAGAPNLTTSDLVAMARNGDLPSGVALSPTDMLSARAALETRLFASPLLGLGTVRVVSVAGALMTSTADGCIHLQSIQGLPFAFRLVVAGPGALSLQPRDSMTLQFFLQLGNDGSITANLLPLELAGGQVTYLNVNIDNATPYIIAPAGALTICGAAPATP